jgi:hypothetical protein
MPKPKPHDIPDIRVEDPEAAYQKFEDFARRVMAVPKKEIDAKLARERTAREKRKR